MGDMETIITDGGRSTSSHPKETRDCTVRALAVLKNIPYDEAHDIMRSLGRKDRKASGRCGSYWKQCAPKIANSRKMSRSGTIAKFALNNPTGRFLVGVNRGAHVTSIIDGVCYDSFKVSPSARVIGAWRIA